MDDSGASVESQCVVVLPVRLLFAPRFFHSLLQSQPAEAFKEQAGKQFDRAPQDAERLSKASGVFPQLRPDQERANTIQLTYALLSCGYTLSDDPEWADSVEVFNCRAPQLTGLVRSRVRLVCRRGRTGVLQPSTVGIVGAAREGREWLRRIGSLPVVSS